MSVPRFSLASKVVRKRQGTPQDPPSRPSSFVPPAPGGDSPQKERESTFRPAQTPSSRLIRHRTRGESKSLITSIQDITPLSASFDANFTFDDLGLMKDEDLFALQHSQASLIGKLRELRAKQAQDIPSLPELPSESPISELSSSRPSTASLLKKTLSQLQTKPNWVKPRNISPQRPRTKLTRLQTRTALKTRETLPPLTRTETNQAIFIDTRTSFEPISQSDLSATLQPTSMKTNKREKTPNFAAKSKSNLRFLPIELYDPMLEHEDPIELFTEYASKGAPVVGYSKWFLPDGSFEWKECTVGKYLDTEDRFEIRWKNGKQKSVTRLNLRFADEDKSQFDARVEEAKANRDKAEVALRYHYQVKQIKTPPPVLSFACIASIFFYLRGGTVLITADNFKSPLKTSKVAGSIRHDPKKHLWKKSKTHFAIETRLYRSLGFHSLAEYKDHYIQSLPPLTYKVNGEVLTVPVTRIKEVVDEVEEDFVMTMRRVEFEADIPFNYEKQQVFSLVLPPSKLLLPSELPSLNACKTGVAEKLQYDFPGLLSSMSTLLHQAYPEHLYILTKLNRNLMEFQETSLFLKDYSRSLDKEKLTKFNRVETGNTIRELRNLMFDTQYDLQDILNRANLAREKRNSEKLKERAYLNQKIDIEDRLPSEFIERLQRLMRLCNHYFERGMRECLERSLLEFKGMFRNVLQEACNVLGFATNYTEPMGGRMLLELMKSKNLQKRLRNSPCIIIELKILTSKKEGKFILEPSPLECTAELLSVVREAVEDLKCVPCLECVELGPLRDDNELHIITEPDDFVIRLIAEFEGVLNQVNSVPLGLLVLLQDVEFLITLDPVKIDKTLRGDFQIINAATQLTKLKTAKVKLEKYLFHTEKQYLGAFIIKTNKVRTHLLELLEKCRYTIITIILEKLDADIIAVKKQEEEIMEVIGHNPANLEQLDEQKTFLNAHLAERREFITETIENIFDYLEVLRDNQFKLDYSLFARSWQAYSLPLKLSQAKLVCEQTIQRFSLIFAEELVKSQEAILEEITEITTELTDLKTISDLSKFEEMSEAFGIMKKRIETASESAKLINFREGLVGAKHTDLRQLEAIKKEFNPFCKLWFFIRDFERHFPKWMRGPLGELDRDAVTDEITLYATELGRMERTQMKEQVSGLELVRALSAKVSDFKPYLPVIRNLRNPGLKERHWDDLISQTGIHLTKQLTVTLEELIRQNIMEFADILDEVAERASKEQALETAKLKMEREWDDIEFTLVPYKDTGTFILVNNDPIWELLDEHIMKTVSMFGSPFIKFMEKDMLTWKNGLLRVQDIIDEWEKLQKTWQYLYPIFTQDDISKQLSVASSRFSQVHSMWESIMFNTSNNKHVLDACLGYPKMFEQLRYGNETLDIILRSLNEYLNSKRQVFPRFYFLANEELLAILSQSKEIEAVQKFIVKCFEGIYQLHFGEHKEISAMQSVEEEVVPFIDAVETRSVGNTVHLKPVEEWLSEVERSMKATLRTKLVDCLDDYKVTERVEWLLKWPAQLIHTANLVIWTSRVTYAIAEGPLAMMRLWESEYDKLNDVVELVRKDLDSRSRITLGTLVVLDVHNKDVIDALRRERVKDVNDFEWIAQLRYYLERELCYVRMIDTEREYGYEYLGNQTRLVITPLTDRCYRTLMGALHLNLGGAPEGPAGTGKTETTKDLAKSLGKKCVVFNCSDQLDHRSMAKFFTGLCCCGAWACFDEFNRIELEVLSVIAEQIMTIQNGVLRKLKNFQFDSVTIPLDPTCAIFITMNPGYAGRSELPDNLKALFRPVAMMIPDYALIAEISLYSFGFKEARALAIKLITSLRLASEQLSTQSHYDYGMRAVITIIKAAGNLKRNHSAEAEDVLILRAINESNLPKFTSEDIPLFKGITHDLFPMSAAAEQRDAQLQEVIEMVTRSVGLLPKTEFCNKVIQLNDTVQVRHGLMLVGQCMAGKSTVISVLAETVSRMRREAVVSSDARQETQHTSDVKMHVVNPKAVTLDQLYGSPDPNTHDWVDGILSHLIRECAEDLHDNMKWVVFDGPVDAVWIENMNTVLDDNKKLCLTSGEIIKISPTMTLMFEVENLNQASPATVSRCGMVYLDPDEVLGFEALVERWLAALPRLYLEEENQTFLRFSLNYFLGHILEFLHDHPEFHRIFNHSTMWLINSFLRLYESFLLMDFTRESLDSEFKDQKERKEAEDQRIQQDKGSANDKSAIRRGTTSMRTMRTTRKGVAKESDNLLQDQRPNILSLLLLSGTWIFGAIAGEEERRLFSELLTRLLSPIEGEVDFNSALQSVLEQLESYRGVSPFSLCYDYTSHKWHLWKEDLELLTRENVTSLKNIFVPTEDTLRYTFLMEHTITRGCNLLLTGTTGTGKSILIKRFLAEKLPSVKYKVGMTAFSAQTTCNQTQDFIESCLTKRRKGVYGPENGKTCIIFIDDLNMPMKEKYGAQPPIEILRQAIDKQEWYDIKNCEVKKLEDLQFVSAMGHPGGGKTYLSERFMRHFLLIGLTELSHETMEHVFRTILAIGLTDYPSVITPVVQVVTSATVAVYEQVLVSLPPTPAKSHYAFNLRDVANIFRGLVSVPNYKMNRVELMYRLWVHECCRVFSDRLVDEGDIETFRNIVQTELERWMQVQLAEVTEGRELLFCHFVDERVYQECTDLEKLRETLELALEENNLRVEKRMDLVLFDFAIHHISRVSRIICASPGNALLIGVGGSGRQSLTRLAAFLQNYEMFQLEMTKKYEVIEWEEDLKSILMKAGVEGKVIVFILRDADLKYSIFLEHINSLLNTGEIPNLHAPEEKELILENLREKRGFSIKTEEERWEAFIENCRCNVHMVICMSPIGSGLRENMRQFPSLVNCCTIDWFTAWPQEALQSVAKRYIIEHDLVPDGALSTTAVHICVYFHTTVYELTQRVLAEKRRYSYVTPTNYLQLLQSFKEIQGFKQETTGKMREKYAAGVKKLDYTQEFVMSLREELLISKPILEEKTKRTEAIMVQITRDTAAADKTRSIVAAEQEESAKQAEVAEQIKAECQKELEQAIPELEAALQSLKTVKKQDLDLIKSMQRPPVPIRLALEGVAIIYGMEPVLVQDPNDRTIVTYDYFIAGKKMMNNPKFIKNLSKYEKENMTQEIVDQLAPYMSNPFFQPSVVRNASSAAEGLCKWIRAMYNFYVVNQRVIPKQQALEAAQAEMDEKFKALQQKQDELMQVELKIDELRKRFDTENSEKQKLMSEIQACEIKLERALRLTEKLSGERKRWEEIVAQLDIDMKNLLGDIILSAGVVSYLGPFFINYREQIVNGQWIPKVLELKEIPCSPTFTLKATLGDPIIIQKWIINGLPSDKVSVENAIIITRSSRWPLIIDPQKQAIKWLRKMIPSNGERLIIAKQQQEDFLNILENAIFVGNVMLLEGVGETIDPRLEPVLLKQVVEKDGVKVIKLGDMFKQYDSHFAFYMTSTLPNPHYTPEISTKVTILNFTITQEGLAEQLLAIVCTNEIRKETEERIRLISQTSQYTKKMQEFEDKILEMLKLAGNDMLEDEHLINSLTESKRMSEEVEKKLSTARVTEQKILEAQENYIPVANRGAALYFCVVDLSNLEPMYEYSIEWFYMLFQRALDQAGRARDLYERIKNLILKFREIMYQNICLSLFEKDKLLFSFMVAVRVKYDEGVNPNEWRFLLTAISGVSDDSGKETVTNPLPSVIEPQMWASVKELSHLPGFESLPKLIGKEPTQWESFITTSEQTTEVESFEAIQHKLPRPYSDPLRYNYLQVLLIIRALKMEVLLPAIRSFVKSSIGEDYIYAPLFDLQMAYNESTTETPLIFVLSPGNDPQSSLKKFAEECKRALHPISLGKDQGERAAKTIKSALQGGNWVLLQNCHLASSWMPELEVLIEKISAEIDAKRANPKDVSYEHINLEFRLWLTSLPSPHFPISILQNGVKMTSEQPKGLRSNMLSIYTAVLNSKEEITRFNSGHKTEEWRKLLFGLSFFHSLIRERRKFGPLGWNVLYEFSDSDYRVSLRQLKLMLDTYAKIPYKALNYLIGECNYGGRVTDDLDRRILLHILSDFIVEGILSEKYLFCDLPNYFVPPDDSDVGAYIRFIEKLPTEDSPEVFGLHENANITCARMEASNLLGRILNQQPRASASQGAEKEKHEIQMLTEEIMRLLPAEYDLPLIMQMYPVKYEESMNTVLTQELGRFNTLIRVVKQSLDDLSDAMAGKVIITSELESIVSRLLNNQVPEAWSKVCYPSRKPLMSWVRNLHSRLSFFQDWIENGPPTVYWISGFFFTQAFLTGTIQNNARKYSHPIDNLEFEFSVLDTVTKAGGSFRSVAPPLDGCYIYGLFLEGARWESAAGAISESNPRELFTEFPVIWLKPVQKGSETSRRLKDKGLYACPVYKTTQRAGTLSTTGHSTNYVLTIKIPSRESEKHWVRRGVAMITQLDD